LELIGIKKEIIKRKIIKAKRCIDSSF